uniref:VP3 n=1 Tax=Japanaut virus TaxID=2547358 RepID=A0A482A5K7_9REOV|nr:VP3 [Japanaut virus]
MAQPVQDANVPKTSSYLKGSEVATDNGPLLSIFALQEIMQKVRDAQSEYVASAREVDLTVPDVQKIIDGLKDMANEKPYKIISAPKPYFRHILMQSHERVLRVNTYYEDISNVGEPIDEDDPSQFYATILAKVRHLRDEGSFILHGIKTRDLRGMEIADVESLGVDLKNVMPILTAENRAMVQGVLDGAIIENGNVADREVDIFIGACPDPVYRIYNRLQAYIEAVQLNELRNAIAWLERLGRRKRIVFSQNYLTDFRRLDTIWIQTLRLPIDPRVIWDVPRCHIVNLIMNIALCVPLGQYVAPNPRISAITLTQRITMTGPFGILSGMTPTSQQMDDVRKIYIALMFPGQIILDLKVDMSERMDPVVRMVAGVVGHIMFTAGRRFTNITQNMARQLDIAMNDFLLYMYNARVPIQYGPTGEPLDFRIGRVQYDCNVFRANFGTGQGYNGWGVNDVERRDPGCYDHVQRFLRYCDIDSREIINPTNYGINMRYHAFDELLRCLIAAGKETEASYFRMMLPFHMVRMARLNQVINEDLHSAFSIPDQQFDALLPNMLNGARGEIEPLVLDISWISIWYAFTRAFEPTGRNELLEIAPMVESMYASELSVMKMDMEHLAQMRARFPELLIHAKPSHFWKATLDVSPTPVKDLMDLAHSYDFVNVRDIMRWVREPAVHRSMKYELEREAWGAANDFEDLMLVDHVYMHRAILPEPQLEDVREFQREGFYYTNMLDGPPTIGQVIQYTYEIARLQANMGRFKTTIRRILDEDGWIRFGGMLRSVKVKFFDSRPPEEILTQIPFDYKHNEEEGLSYATIKYATEAVAYYLVYKVEYSNTPDSLILINPTYTMTAVYIGKRIVERVQPGQLLAVLGKRYVAYKSKMRIMDITGALKTGVHLAAPAQ